MTTEGNLNAAESGNDNEMQDESESEKGAAGAGESETPISEIDSEFYPEFAAVWDSELEAVDELPDWQVVYEYATRCAKRSNRSRERQGDVEDIVQYVVNMLYLKDLRVRSWKAYVRTMVKNREIDLYRRRKAERRSIAPLPEPGAYGWQVARTVMNSPIATVKPQDLSNELAANSVLVHVLAEVPEHHRELFIDYLEGIPPEHLAEIYGYASARSVTQTISRIKRNLRERFQSESALYSEFD